MKQDIRVLRRYAAERHRNQPQEYEKGVPYWVHLLICELLAIAFALGMRTRRVVWGHDLKEDTGATGTDLINAGWTPCEAGDIDRVTDEPGANRKERKKKTYPKTARGGRGSIGPKLCDRGANLLFGLLSGSFRMHKKYKGEQPKLEHYLFDKSDTELLPLWYFVQSLLQRRPRRISAANFAQRPLRQLIDKWVANEEFIMNADEADLLAMWHELKALLDAQD